MSDFRVAVARLRRDAGWPENLPLSVETLLPRLYPVATVLLPRLSICRLRDWLAQHSRDVPPGLRNCGERPLRGAVIAWRGCGLLCADAEDSEPERRFTYAHEAAHFLRDHLYPRQDLLARYGPGLLPVLDGFRAPHLKQRIDALLGRTWLTLHTHLLERDDLLPGTAAQLSAAESEADAFACEILAPSALLAERFPHLPSDEEAVGLVRSALMIEFGLPLGPATAWARRFVARHGEPVTILHRMGLA